MHPSSRRTDLSSHLAHYGSPLETIYGGMYRPRLSDISPNAYGRAVREVTKETRLSHDGEVYTGRASPIDDVFITPATSSSTLPRGILRRQPITPPNTPYDSSFDPPLTAQASTVLPRPSTEVDLSVRPHEPTSFREKHVRQWLRAQSQPINTPHELGSPLGRMILGERDSPNTPSSPTPRFSKPFNHFTSNRHGESGQILPDPFDRSSYAPSPTETGSNSDFNSANSSTPGASGFGEDDTPCLAVYPIAEFTPPPSEPPPQPMPTSIARCPPLHTPDRGKGKIPTKYGSPLPAKFYSPGMSVKWDKLNLGGSPFERFYTPAESPLRGRS